MPIHRCFPMLATAFATVAAAAAMAAMIVVLPVSGTDGHAAAQPADASLVERGEYLFHAGACDSCHTDHDHDGPFLAGGRAMTTQFGTFYTPNITPDRETGIGDWTLEDFRRAMIEGLSPRSAPYYPIFPYAWYTGMTDDDVAALKAYLDTVEPVRNAVPPHDLKFPFSVRPVVFGWRLLNFDQGQTVQDDTRSPEWNRGAYLVNHLGHCGACHTTKVMGNFLPWRFLAGAGQIPGPYPAPNITPDIEAGIGTWSREDVVRVLRRAMLPDGLPARGAMAEYVVSGSSHLDDADLAAMAEYLLSVEPDEHRIGREEAPSVAPAGGTSLGALGDLVFIRPLRE